MFHISFFQRNQCFLPPKKILSCSGLFLKITFHLKWIKKAIGLLLPVGSFGSKTKWSTHTCCKCEDGSLIWLVRLLTSPQLIPHRVWQWLCMWAGSYKCGRTLPPFFSLWGIGRPFSKRQQTPFSSGGAQTMTWRWASGWSGDRMRQIDSVKRGRCRGWEGEGWSLGRLRPWGRCIGRLQWRSSNSWAAEGYMFLQFTISLRDTSPPNLLQWWNELGVTMETGTRFLCAK